jgi:hypothetical protein
LRRAFHSLHPPDLQEEAVRTVLAQAELLCSDWTGSMVEA